MSKQPGAKRRRTQVERTATTVNKLLESTIDAIMELGYPGATTRDICDRAGVSQGGLFRHFPTRHDLVVAAVSRLNDEQVAAFEEIASRQLARGGDDVARQVREARAHARNPRNVVWLEVLLAARTEPDLLEAVRPLMVSQNEAVLRAAEHHPRFAQLSTQSKRVWIDIARQVFEAEVLWDAVLPQNDLDEPKLEALVRLLYVLDESDRARPAADV